MEMVVDSERAVLREVAVAALVLGATVSAQNVVTALLTIEGSPATR